MAQDPPRPPRKGRHLNLKTTDEDFAAAEARAQAEGRSLADVVRSFLHIFGIGEWPSPPVMPGEGRRAQKQPRKRKARGGRLPGPGD